MNIMNYVLTGPSTSIGAQMRNAHSDKSTNDKEATMTHDTNDKGTCVNKQNNHLVHKKGDNDET